MKIITEESVLRQKSKETSIKEVDKTLIVGHLKTAIKSAWTPGCGLAAIQIGIPLRVAWYHYGNDQVVMINPEITEKDFYVPFQREGCLSIPNKKYNTGRYDNIAVKADCIINDKVKKDYTIVASGFEACVIQHEIDHMDGILCKDKIREYKKPFEQKRNAPCKCGSGIKYKKCCMKNNS